MKIKSLLALILLAVSVMLVGCSGEPSESDIRSALDKDVAQSAATMKAMTGSSNLFGKTEIHSVKKIRCKEANDSSGFYCDFEIDITAPMVGRQKDVGKALFVKAKDGWTAVSK